MFGSTAQVVFLCLFGVAGVAQFVHARWLGQLRSYSAAAGSMLCCAHFLSLLLLGREHEPVSQAAALAAGVPLIVLALQSHLHRSRSLRRGSVCLLVAIGLMPWASGSLASSEVMTMAAACTLLAAGPWKPWLSKAGVGRAALLVLAAAGGLGLVLSWRFEMAEQLLRAASWSLLLALLAGLTASQMQLLLASFRERLLAADATWDSISVLTTQMRQDQQTHKGTGHRLSMALKAGHFDVWEANLETGAVFRPSDEGDGVQFFRFRNVAQYLTDVAEADRVKLELMWQQLRRKEISSVTVEYARAVENSTRHFSTSAELVWHEDLGVQTLVGVTRDITDLVVAREAEQARLQAVRANEVKSQFVASLAHELRTPLNAVLNFSRFIEEDQAVPDEPREMARYVVQAGEHMLGLVGSVMELASLEAHRFEVNCRSVDVSPVLQAVQSMMAPAAKNANITLSVDVRVEAWARGDDMRVRQILLNLVSNAIKYNRPNGHVRVWAVAAADSLMIHVEDTGDGLSASEIAQLFTPFERLKRHKGRIEGNGIGLALSRELAMAMEGTLTVTSKQGTGSRFTLALPFSRGAGRPTQRPRGAEATA